jgi:hypothetical protein
MTFFNKVLVNCYCKTFCVLSVLVFGNAHCNDLILNDVIDSLPTDSFVKVFLDRARPIEISESRVPILLLYFQRGSSVDDKTHCKFFHVGRNIGSRTHNIINLLQFGMEQISYLHKKSQTFYSHMRNFVDGKLTFTSPCCFWGSITQTILLGDNALYKQMTTNFPQIRIQLAENVFRNDAAFLFDLRSSLSHWKICRIIQNVPEDKLLCLYSATIVPDMFHSKSMTKAALAEAEQSSLDVVIDNSYEVKERYYLHSIRSLLTHEVFVKYNASYHGSQETSLK